jgi:hypothetical protein
MTDGPWTDQDGRPALTIRTLRRQVPRLFTDDNPRRYQA